MPSKVIDILVIDKVGTIKTCSLKEHNENDFYKKAGLKKPDGFQKYTEWIQTMDDIKWCIVLYGKIDGKANTENKYEFPPPVDKILFFGSCLLIGYQIKSLGKKEWKSLSIETWNKIYEKLFGGFDDLSDYDSLDENDHNEEEDDDIPPNKKTKQGYLKDGFVVDTDSDFEEEEEEDDNSNYNHRRNQDSTQEWYKNTEDSEMEVEDLGSELEEEAYSDEEVSEEEEEEDDKKKKKFKK